VTYVGKDTSVAAASLTLAHPTNTTDLVGHELDGGGEALDSLFAILGTFLAITDSLGEELAHLFVRVAGAHFKVGGRELSLAEVEVLASLLVVRRAARAFTCGNKVAATSNGTVLGGGGALVGPRGPPISAVAPRRGGTGKGAVIHLRLDGTEADRGTDVAAVRAA